MTREQFLLSAYEIAEKMWRSGAELVFGDDFEQYKHFATITDVNENTPPDAPVVVQVTYIIKTTWAEAQSTLQGIKNSSTPVDEAKQ